MYINPGEPSIFPYMHGILYNQNDSFSERVANQRKSMLHQDACILADKGVEFAFDSWDTVPDNRFSVTHKNYQFDCIFSRKNGPLYVILNAALSETPPEFKRWTYYNFLNGSMLNMADPMYRIYEGTPLKLGWYYGDAENNLREYTAEVIRKAARMLGYANEQIILLGSSCGGAAAIQIGALIDGCTVIAINAQIKLSLYCYHEIFTEITGIGVEAEDEIHRNDTSWYLMNSGDSKTKYIMIYNLLSQVDTDQITHISNKWGINPGYGLSKFENVTFWLYDAPFIGYGGPHGAQEYNGIFWCIDYLGKYLRSHTEISQIQDLYLLFNEFWCDHFSLVETNMKSENQSAREIRALDLKLPYGTVKEMETVYEASELVLSGNGENYVHSLISDRLQPDSLYCLHIGDANLNQCNCHNYTVLVKDEKKRSIYLNIKCAFHESTNLFFTTSKETDTIELRIYAGNPAKTADVSITLTDISLHKI